MKTVEMIFGMLAEEISRMLFVRSVLGKSELAQVLAWG